MRFARFTIGVTVLCSAFVLSSQLAAHTNGNESDPDGSASGMAGSALNAPDDGKQPAPNFRGNPDGTGEECGTVISPDEKGELLARHNQIFFEPPGLRRGLPYYIPVTYHVIRQSDGSGGIGEDQLCQGITDLNTAYANTGMIFYVQPPIDYIDSDDFYFNIDTDAEIDAMLMTNPVANTINVYCTPNLAKTDSMGNIVGLCGRGSFTTSTPQGVAMNNGCLGLVGVNQSTFPHEVGHFFDLFHTHETAYGDECVDGSNCTTAGDLLCDTPADPNVSGDVNSSCVYTGGATDPCNNDPYNPDATNYMSYSTKVCRDFFSPDQEFKVGGTLTLFRPNLINDTIPLSADCNQNEVSDFCEPDCNMNGVPDDCDIADGTSPDCNSNGIPDECDIDPNDPDGNGMVSPDCQPNGIPDECDIDPNDPDGNGMVSPDCQPNGVPDECDLADGTSQDCNNNMVPDECDIMSGNSQDCQPDGIPDECQLGNCLNQYSNQAGALASDVACEACGTQVQIAADQFVLGAGSSILGFRWRGVYAIADDAAIHDRFMIEIRHDNAGVPSASGVITIGPFEADLKLDTGVLNNGYREFEYTHFFSNPVALSPGTFWVLIYNDTQTTPDSWNWSFAPVDPANGLPGGVFSTAGTNGPWNPASDLALQVLCGTFLDNDCNANGVPDDCEIAAGGDCNNNTILDECETKPDGDPSVAVEQDLCENAMIVCPGFDYVGSSVGSTLSDGTFFCGLFYSTRDVWYRYRPAYDGLCFIRVEGPPWYWLYAVYDGCPAAGGLELNCNTSDHFQVTFPAKAGHDYYIRIGAHGINAVGEFEMNLVGPPCALNPIDLNGNGIPDDCECAEDVNSDNVVDMLDFLDALAQVGSICPCTGDVNGDGVVDDTDLFIILNSFGPCPTPILLQQNVHGNWPLQGLGTGDLAGTKKGK